MIDSKYNISQHLQFDSFPVQLDCSDFEVDPNCGNVRLCVGIVRKPKRISGFEIEFGADVFL